MYDLKWERYQRFRDDSDPGDSDVCPLGLTRLATRLIGAFLILILNMTLNNTGFILHPCLGLPPPSLSLIGAFLNLTLNNTGTGFILHPISVETYANNHYAAQSPKGSTCVNKFIRPPLPINGQAYQ